MKKQPDALNFLYIVSTLRDLVIVKRALASLTLAPKYNPHTKDTTFFIGVDDIVPDDFKVEKIESGIYQGFYLIKVSHLDSSTKPLIKALKKIDARVHFLGYSPGWDAMPTYLLYTGRRFPWVYKLLGRNKDLEKASEIGDNGSKEKP